MLEACVVNQPSSNVSVLNEPSSSLVESSGRLGFDCSLTCMDVHTHKSTSFACVHSTCYARFLNVVMYLFWCLCELDGRINAFLILYAHKTLGKCDAIDENY